MCCLAVKEGGVVDFVVVGIECFSNGADIFPVFIPLAESSDKGPHGMSLSI